jgi:prephenate dehydratase
VSEPSPSPAAAAPPGSARLQANRPVAFQGEPGAYSEAAVLEHFGGSTITLPCESFDAVFSAVENGQADCGLIAIENSLAGSIHHNYDLLIQHQLWITGEHYLRVRHCLIANPGVRMDQIRKVISHPQALAQCSAYLRGRGLSAEVFYDTAGSVKHLKETGSRDLAGIASRRAAEVYGMQILEEDIEDNPANFTRFLVISPQPVEPGEQAKTTIVFTLNNQPGSLYRALSVFALRDIDLSKIESRPLVGRPWEYLFYIDILSAMRDPAAVRALANLEEYASSVRVLGSYTRHVFG